MRRALGFLCVVSPLLTLPAAAMASEGTATVVVPTPRGTTATSGAAHLVFALPAGHWVQDTGLDDTPTPGVYNRQSEIGGHVCTVSVYVSGYEQIRRPIALAPGRLPIDRVHRGAVGPYRWFTARSTGEPGPAAPSPYASAYRRAPRASKWKYARIAASVGFTEPTTSACHRSGARVDLRPLVTSFRVAAGAGS